MPGIGGDTSSAGQTMAVSPPWGWRGVWWAIYGFTCRPSQGELCPEPGRLRY
jgi:hypothetical protein